MNIRHLALAIFVAGALHAQDLTVEGTGYGPTVDAATRAANRAAIEKGIGQVVTSQTEIENFQTKKDLVLTRTEGAVKSSEVINKTQGPDGVWEVSVKAVVSKAEIRQDLMALAILRSAVGNPRVAVIVNETVLGNLVADGTTEIAIINSFKSREFEVVEPSDALRAKRAKQIAMATGGDLKIASELGAELGAEVVIVGTATATEADMSANPYFQNSGMKSASGALALKAIDVNTKEILASKSGDAPMVHPNATVAGTKALEKATQKLVEQQNGNGLIDQLIKAWQDKANNGNLLRVRIQNIPNYQASQIVTEEIRALAVKVDSRKLSDKILFLDVGWRGTADDFCKEMDDHKVNKDRNKLSVVSVEGNSVLLEVK
ncbi:MAG: hypothetical protein RL173_142 [Fibrobacterota bacterium]